MNKSVLSKAKELAAAEKRIDINVLTRYYYHSQDINAFNQAWAYLQGINLPDRKNDEIMEVLGS